MGIILLLQPLLQMFLAVFVQNVEHCDNGLYRGELEQPPYENLDAHKDIPGERDDRCSAHYGQGYP